MAPLAKHVYGVEVVPQAIKDAEDNATKTNLKYDFRMWKSRRCYLNMEITRD